MITCLLTACNYLDFDETNGLNTRENIYRYFESTEQMLTTVYSYMPQDFGTVGGSMRDAASDDAEYADASGSIQHMNRGSWSAIRTIDDQWGLYDGVRAANEFLDGFETTDFSRYQHDLSYKQWMKKLELFPYEARVLRAFYFFELAKRYGDIPMPLKKLSTKEANEVEKVKFEDVIAFIVSECDDAMKVLPDTYIGQPNNETGRVTKGFAMAVKSRALLYLASPLHNPTNDKTRWVNAAQAALDIINTGLYSLDPADKVNNVASKEVVLFRMNGTNSNFELRNFPIRFTEGQRQDTLATAVFPTQNLVDAFETMNGYPVTLGANGFESADPDFDPQRPYHNRDPRLAKTVLAHGMKFKGSTIDLSAQGADSAPLIEGGSATGYFLRKYIQETTSFKPDHTVSNQHHWVIYRYAETLLTYAEAMVQAFGDPLYTDGTFTHSATWALNQVRKNANMPERKMTDKEQFLKAIMQECRVEFAFEDHRFWDVRRWMIGSQTQKDIYGVDIKRDTQGQDAYAKKAVETRTWEDRMYLYPIPQSELYKNANLAPQNKGW